MHVPGLNQRRKTKPRDLHIRKVSFSGSSVSGSSLSSGSSFSSASSTSTARADNASHASTGSTLSFDPLQLHPTFQAPPRLQDRPLIHHERRPYETEAAFYDDDEGSDFGDMDHSTHEEQFHMELPPHTSPMDHADEIEEPQDYFHLQFAKRPPMPRSHWSVSTIQTLDLDQYTPITSASDPSSGCFIADNEDGEVASRQPTMSVPNFSYKRPVTPRRPPFKSMDSVDDLIKRGGWKRRGIVFNNEDIMDSYNFSC